MKGYIKVKVSESFFGGPQYTWIVVEILGKRPVEYSDIDGSAKYIMYLVKDKDGNMFEESSVYLAIGDEEE
jgi:hypothetical protein